MGIKRVLIWPSILALFYVGALQAAPVELVLPDVRGAAVRLSDYRGKWVAVNFWATWCPPCREEMPELEAFHAKHKDGQAMVLSVNMEEIEDERLRQFVKELGVSFPVVRMEPQVETALGKVFGMPTTFLVDPQGEVVARQVGTVTAKALEAAIERRRAAAEGGS